MGQVLRLGRSIHPSLRQSWGCCEDKDSACHSLPEDDGRFWFRCEVVAVFCGSIYWTADEMVPTQEDTGVAAIATTFSNQATAELEDMKRYADAQALQRAFKGNKTVSLLVGAMGARSESLEARTVATKKAKQELDNQYQKVLIRPANSPGREVSSRKEEEMISCDRSAHIMARREIEPQPLSDSRSALPLRKSFTNLSSVNEVVEGVEEAGDRTEERYVNVSL